MQPYACTGESAVTAPPGAEGGSAGGESPAQHGVQVVTGAELVVIGTSGKRFGGVVWGWRSEGEGLESAVSGSVS